jgi:hypothetical protein
VVSRKELPVGVGNQVKEEARLTNEFEKKYGKLPFADINRLWVRE